jgi:N-methylhydantoinase A/oxoprolinase/acetone carboxylase beta subunit
VERLIAWWAGFSAIGPRPASVAVEIEIAPEGERSEDVEADLPEEARALLQRAVELTCRNVSEIMKPASSIVSLPSSVTAEVAAVARRPSRTVYWADLGRAVETPVYDGIALRPGNSVAGPSVVETPDTTVVVPPGQRLSVDRFGNFEIELGEGRPQ